MPFARHARPWAWALAGSLALACVANAEPRELEASVVWTRADLVYVAASDSGVLLPGMTLSLFRGRHELASAGILKLLEPRLAVARLSAGSLAGERRLDRLRVRGESPAIARVSRLRVGLPGRGRANLLFACGVPGVFPHLGSAGYTLDSLAASRYMLVRDSSGADSPAAPDTLLVRLFADAADQEIALERGELDVAVFWPGELSARMRTDARWRDAARGVRARGVLAGVAAATDSAAAPAAGLGAMNHDAFGGDLLAWSELEPDPSPAAPAAPARWAVDPALPGAHVLERVLARSAAAGGERTVRLAYLDVPLAAHDSVQAAWRTRGVTPLFAVRCPVLASAAARECVTRIGPDAFANLVSCAGGTP